MKTSTIAIFLAAIFSSAAHAANWQVVGTVETKVGETEVELDRSSIVDFGSHRQFWARTSFPPQTAKNIAYSSSLMLVEVSCGIRQWRVASLKAYEKPNGEGKLVLSRRSGTAWVPVEPDSVGEVLYEAGCE